MTDIADRIGEVIQKALAVSSVVQGREVYVKLTDLHEVVARLQALKTKARYAERAAAEADAKVCPLAIADHLREVLTEAREFIDGYSDVVDGSYGEPEPNRAMTLVSIIDAALTHGGEVAMARRRQNTGNHPDPLADAQDALDRMKRASESGTGCHLTAEMIQALSVTIIGQMMHEDRPHDQ